MSKEFQMFRKASSSVRKKKKRDSICQKKKKNPQNLFKMLIDYCNIWRKLEQTVLCVKELLKIYYQYVTAGGTYPWSLFPYPASSQHRALKTLGIQDPKNTLLRRTFVVIHKKVLSTTPEFMLMT